MKNYYSIIQGLNVNFSFLILDVHTLYTCEVLIPFPLP